MRIGVCKRCKEQRWVNHATGPERASGEFCAECFEKIPHNLPGTSRNGGSSGPFHNDPGFDNIIRALEEDR